MRNAALSLCTALFMTTTLLADVLVNQVHWRIEDGGNGHWYEALLVEDEGTISFQEAFSAAGLRGGYLVTITSQSEDNFIRANVANDEILWSDLAWGYQNTGPWIGCHSVNGADWFWVTPEPWGFTNWHPGNPNEGPNAAAFLFDLDGNDNGYGWQDQSTNPNVVISYIVEYDHDPNGPLPVTTWAETDGGNGHLYQTVRMTAPISWSQAHAIAESLGGYLATVASEEENQVIYRTGRPYGWTNPWAAGPWLGGFYANGQWRWVTGEPWVFSNWGPGEPNEMWGEHWLHFNCYEQNCALWNNTFEDGGTAKVGFVIEWSADCNNDGFVDYGQILAGELSDLDGNGVPDCCDQATGCACTSDLNHDRVVDGADISILLGWWATDGKTMPSPDLDHNGVVDGVDLALLLGDWGPCE